MSELITRRYVLRGLGVTAAALVGRRYFDIGASYKVSKYYQPPVWYLYEHGQFFPLDQAGYLDYVMGSRLYGKPMVVVEGPSRG